MVCGLYEEVVVGRAEALGDGHPDTLTAKRECVQRLSLPLSPFHRLLTAFFLPSHCHSLDLPLHFAAFPHGWLLFLQEFSCLSFADEAVATLPFIICFSSPLIAVLLLRHAVTVRMANLLADLGEWEGARV